MDDSSTLPQVTDNLAQIPNLQQSLHNDTDLNRFLRTTYTIAQQVLQSKKDFLTQEGLTNDQSTARIEEIHKQLLDDNQGTSITRDKGLGVALTQHMIRLYRALGALVSAKNTYNEDQSEQNKRQLDLAEKQFLRYIYVTLI